jgi:hypothetical protein
MRTTPFALALLLVLCQAIGAQTSNFATHTFEGGVAIDVPKAWQLLNENIREHLEASAEALAKQRGQETDFGTYRNLIAANAYTVHRTASATMRLAIQTRATSTQEEVLSMTSQELAQLREPVIALLEAGFRAQGVAQTIEWVGATRQQVGGSWAVKMAYRRIKPGGEATYVEVYQFFLGNREVKLTLSCRDDEKSLFLVVLKTILDSLRLGPVGAPDAAAFDAQGASVEEVAAEIARRSNLNAGAMSNDITQSFSARAVGKNVIFENVLRIKVDLPKDKLAEYQSKTQEEVVPRVCRNNAENEVFKQGLFYTFVYRNTAGDEVARFSADVNICSLMWPWTLHRDQSTGFQMSYPRDWTITPNTGNVKFSVVSLLGVGACNITSVHRPELSGQSQSALNSAVSALPSEHDDWAVYLGSQLKLQRLLESRRGNIQEVRTLVGLFEATVDMGDRTRFQKAILAIALTPGLRWVLTCGSAQTDREKAQADFDALRPTYDRVLASLAFLQTGRPAR